jgi:outer membrane protein OmpA-like peptidoglycan-associated protein
MERAAAAVVGGIGLVLLTFVALVLAWPGPSERSPGVAVAVLATAPTVPGAALAGSPTSEPPDGDVPPAPRPVAPASPTTATGLPASSPARAAAAPSAALGEAIRQVTDGGIRFALNRADLDDPARQLLDRLAGLLAGEPGVVIVVQGYTDSTGSDAINGPLSERRASAVREYLLATGVPAGQVVAQGLGSADPVADNATAQGRQANRRSDVVVKGGG